ncbi:glycosyltransferase [Thermodesulfobacteriota bacterium]
MEQHMNKRFCYLCIDGATSVIESQVISHLELIHESGHGISFDLFLLSRTRDAEESSLFNPQRKRELEERMGGRLIVGTFNSVLTGFLFTLWLLFRFTFPACFTKKLILHPRALDGGFMAACFKWMCLGFPRVVFDERDDAPSEFIFEAKVSGRSRWSVWFLINYYKHLLMEWFAVRSATKVIYVSNALRGIMEKRYPFSSKKSGGVFPSLCDERMFFFNQELRKKKRKELGLLVNQYVLAYVGGVESYQHFNETIVLYKECRRIKADMFFIFITRKRNHEAVLEKLRTFLPEKSCMVEEMAHDQVCEVLNAADMGVLLREPSEASIGASPVKFAEYLLCGLPIVLPKGIGDYSKLIKDENMGVVAEDLMDIEGLARKCIKYLDGHGDEKNRKRIASLARQRLSRQSRIPDYISFYHSI